MSGFFCRCKNSERSWVSIHSGFHIILLWRIRNVCAASGQSYSFIEKQSEAEDEDVPTWDTQTWADGNRPYHYYY